MATSYSGGIRPFYGRVITDKCKSADHNTLRAYKTVCEDLLKDASGAEAQELKDSIQSIDKALHK
jgi:hypothetical protein